MSRPSQLLLLAGFTLLLHLPFLARPVQGDEVNYLDIASQALHHPLTPLDFRYVFQGHEVDMAGHPHPPLNAYTLGVVWRLAGGIRPFAFHCAYLLFALIISFSTYALAGRFTSRPLWAAMLVASAPVVQVAANTLESDAPALAFLLAGAALFLARRFAGAAVFLVLAGFSGLQTLVVAPILLLDYVARRERPPRAAWMAAAAPFVWLIAWQVLQLALTQRLPAAVLAGYLTSPAAFGRLSFKLASIVALVGHLGVLVVFLPLAWRFRLLPTAYCLLPSLLAAALVRGYPWWERVLLFLFVAAGVHALLWLWNARQDQPFLSAWCLFYFSFALLAFFAGSARYLLPLAAPLTVLFVRSCESRPGRLAAAVALNVFLGLNLSFADYEFARAYATLDPPPGRSFLVNGEWGFRYYMIQKGGRILERSSVPQPGEWMVASELCLGANYGSLAEAAAVPLLTRELTVRTPVRLVDRFAHSGYSSAGFGLLPFSFSERPLDRITYARTSPFLFLDSPWTPTQFSGRLVFVPQPGATIRLPLEAGATRLRFALFAQGAGEATFLIRDRSGNVLLDRTVQARNELWEVREIPIAGLRELALAIHLKPQASSLKPEVRAGWGELVTYQ